MGVDVVEWSGALDVRLSEWCCSVSMVWVLFKYIQQHTLQVLQRTAIGPSPHNAGPVKEVEALIVFAVVSGIYV
jgi:hypothetical protein